MSIYIEENNCGAVKALGCHVDLVYDEVNIDAEYTPEEGRRDILPNKVPTSCEITALHIRVRRFNDPVKIDRCHFGENVIRDWEAEICDAIESEE